ncbi:unnamed protein product [Onchocerca flexuosa]|uniref:Neur_chan_memb domain-containing protein n=1 Tax=Onchocerca flexuosa TaxID=387005 RepID=A0A183HWP1_9BILA|nr:unnamed protein product [Onchocerca flexuosa]
MFGCVGYIFLSIVELAIVGMLEKATASRSREDESDSCAETSLLITEKPRPNKRLFRENRRRKLPLTERIEEDLRISGKDLNDRLWTRNTATLIEYTEPTPPEIMELNEYSSYCILKFFTFFKFFTKVLLNLIGFSLFA